MKIDLFTYKGDSMDQRDLELIGDEREKALQKCRESFDSWGLTIPDVPPCPFHFGLEDFYNVGEIEFDINNNVEEGYCGKSFSF
jgi:hypothetical protein